MFSAPPPKGDIRLMGRHVREVPTAELRDEAVYQRLCRKGLVLRGKASINLRMWKIVAALLFVAEPALACSCDREIAHNIIQYVPIAFVGKIIRVEAGPDISPARPGQITTIEISNVLKGSPSNPAHVYTHTDEAACGWDFSRYVGQTLRVPVNTDDEGRMTTTYCAMVDINRPPPPRRK
jgi:hypothetical protein